MPPSIYFINSITIIWEVFWLVVGLVCMAFSWWVVFIAESFNIGVLSMLISYIADDF